MAVIFRTVGVAALAILASVACHAQGVLEDFSSVRRSAGGEQLWAPIYSEDPGQSYSFENGMLKMVGDGGTSGCYTGCGIYFHFMPYPYVYPGGFAQYYMKSGGWDPEMNRLRFKLKCSNSVWRSSNGSDNIQIGTYVKQHNEWTSNFQGQHYYHLLGTNVYSNRWMIVELNATPQHQVGQGGMYQPPNDPEWNKPSTGAKVHYFDGLTRFYFDTMGSQWSRNTCYFDDFEFAKKTGEPDFQVSSLTGTHNGSAYEVTWAAPKEQNITYEIRYSTSSMKSAGFASGTDGGTARSTGNAYTGVFWRSPNMPESSTGFYVAIRPSGQSAFTELYIPAMNVPSSPISNKCDVNSDGAVNATDIAAARDAAIGAAGCTADLDSNGRCDVVDLQRIVNASLGGSCRVGM